MSEDREGQWVWAEIKGEEDREGGWMWVEIRGEVHHAHRSVTMHIGLSPHSHVSHGRYINYKNPYIFFKLTFLILHFLSGA